MKFVFSSSLLLTFALFATLQIHACDCESDPLVNGKPMTVEQRVEKAFQKSSAIFLGKVLSVRKIRSGKNKGGSADKTSVIFEVENVWKNRIRRRITISTDSEDARCGYGFVAGQKYLVYTYGDKDFWTNTCTRTAMLDGAREDVEVLDKLKKKLVK